MTSFTAHRFGVLTRQQPATNTSRPALHCMLQRPLPSRRLQSSRLRAGAAPDIHVIITDVDGTLLDSQQQLPDRVASAINKAIDADVQVLQPCSPTPPPHPPLCHCTRIGGHRAAATLVGARRLGDHHRCTATQQNRCAAASRQPCCSFKTNAWPYGMDHVLLHSRCCPLPRDWPTARCEAGSVLHTVPHK
jgi:hypothetical protein